jgi:hypothetical protein
MPTMLTIDLSEVVFEGGLLPLRESARPQPVKPARGRKVKRRVVPIREVRSAPALSESAQLARTVRVFKCGGAREGEHLPVGKEASEQHTEIRIREAMKPPVSDNALSLRESVQPTAAEVAESELMATIAAVFKAPPPPL